ncbi:MAG: hypothetical protein H6R01_215 [Burkholderiaceae bacterium]|nr:hypothetical protein [Burkholderiaceae bacterium]
MEILGKTRRMHYRDKMSLHQITKSGGLTSLRQMDSEYANLLGLATKPKRKSCTTN